MGQGKKRKGDISDDELNDLAMNVLPKRESSRRKAKENSSTKRILQEKMLAGAEDDSDAEKDIDLSDSDDDATWTPFKEKEAKEQESMSLTMGKSNGPGGKTGGQPKQPRPAYMDDLDDDDEDDEDDEDEAESDEDGQPLHHPSQPSPSKKAKFGSPPATSAVHSVQPAPKSMPAVGRVAVGTATQLVPEGQEFKTGDFVMLTTDAERDNAPIWRLDSKTLLQRYNPLPGSSSNGDCLHKSANLFTGFVQSNRERYASVAVKFVSVDSNSYTVKVIKSASDTELRTRSRNETGQFQENFEVYIQALISQCLDANFLDEVFSDQDEYFVSNIEKVDSVTLLRKDKVMNGVSWPARFRRAVSTWPFLNDLGEAAAQESKCGACERDKTSTMIQMYGQPYNQNTLKPVPPDEQASLNRNFSVCQKCSRIAALFHRLHHQKHRMFSECNDVVEGRKKANPALDTTKILNELLANDKWLEQQFKKMQDVWADADTFVR